MRLHPFLARGALALALPGCAGPTHVGTEAPVPSTTTPGPEALARADAAIASGHYGQAGTALLSALAAPGAGDGGSAVRSRLVAIARVAPLPVAASVVDAVGGPGREELVRAGVQEIRRRARGAPDLEADLARIGVFHGGLLRPAVLSDSLEVRVVLPLLGAGRLYGLALASGLRSALTGQPVRLSVWDAGADLVTAASASAGACSGWIPGLLAGSALTGPTAVLGAVAEARAIPLLSFSAGDERVLRLGDWVYSSAPHRLYQGQQLARALIDAGRIHGAAVLSPEGSADDGLARGFAAAATRLLGKDVQVLRYRDATRIGRLAEQLRGESPDVIVLDGDGGQVVALESQLAYYEVRAKLAGGEELRPGALPRETAQRVEGGYFVDPVWKFMPYPTPDPLDTWKAEAAAMSRNARGDTDPSGDPELAEAVWKGYAAGRIAIAALTGGTVVGPHTLRRALDDARTTLDADSTAKFIVPAGAHLEVRELSRGGAKPLR